MQNHNVDEPSGDRNSCLEQQRLTLANLIKPVAPYEWQCLLCLPKVLNIKFDKTSVSNFSRHIKSKHPSYHEKYLMLRKEGNPNVRINRKHSKPYSSLSDNPQLSF